MSREARVTGEPPRVAIVTPSYRMARFIGETVDSVLAQDYPHLDYVVVDGGSGDGTAELLEERGVNVSYAIHPIAGRMPGHMNVLLAEANVPYPQLKEMEEINPEFPRADVALVVGANDVTNPAARSNPASPIYGMPILNVDEAKNVVVIKRSMRPGYAGIDNELYLDPKTGMLFGDAKEALSRLVAAVKAL